MTDNPPSTDGSSGGRSDTERPGDDDPCRPDGGVSDEIRAQIESDPFCALLDISLVDLGPGHARMRLPVTDDLLNFHGSLHGGAVYTLADAAFAAASNAEGDATVALETNISYLEPVDTGTVLEASAERTHRTRRTAEYVVVVTAGEDRIATFRGRGYVR